jgi:glycosyltransferase involved in cell wall biosynthesis
MYNGKRVSLILPTLNEKGSIRKVIEDFERLGMVDEIIVVNNNAVEGTSEEVAATTATEVFEPVAGYGSAIRRGLQEASGDLMVICEPDDTFLADDIHKLLAYSAEVGIVYGSRTVTTFIWEGANMGNFLRYGNWATAKVLEVLFNTISLSDVGCTYRIIRRDALEVLTPKFRVRSSFFGPEMMVLGHLHCIASVQIPVRYKARIGQSSVTGDFRTSVKLGLQMLMLIVAMRLGLHHWIVSRLEPGDPSSKA